MVTVAALALLSLVMRGGRLYPTFAAPPAPQSTPFVMTIVHTNDLHSHDQPFLENGNSVGGFARIAYLIKRIKAETPNVVAVDAGDIFQGTPFYRIYHGRVEVELLNKAGYDIYTIGNHEFDNGPINLARQLSLAHFQILCANLDVTAQPQLARLIKPGVIEVIGGHKVGFVGVITPELMRVCLQTDGVHPYGVTKPADAVPSDWYKPVADEVKHLEDAGADKIIAVSHCGVDLDKEMAEAIPSIDAIIGGHSHTRLSSPVVVNHDDGSPTYIVQTGCYGRALGKFQLCFDAQGHIIPTCTHYKLIPITDHISEDPDIAALLAEKGKPVEALEKIVLGRARGTFSNKFQHCPNDSALGDLICDALAESGKKYGITISLQNRGGMRQFIAPGPVTEAEVEEVLPFENTIVYATIPGATLKQVLEHAVERKPRGPFLDVHGLQFSYDLAKPPGSRIDMVYVQNGKGDFEPLKVAAQYKIAVNSFTFSGGEAYSFSNATNVVDSKLRTAEILENYIKQHHVIVPHTDGRITAVNQPDAGSGLQSRSRFGSYPQSSTHTGSNTYANH